MSKICSKCEKSVYPLEELKCLDKIWHKLCFKCSECGMLLNMKNYKGYNKQPYCVAHYPKTKATAVAETPELARVAQNTKQQSLVKYHEEFEKKIKGSKIEVADDQETQRVMKVNALVSQLEYKGKKAYVAPPPANKPKAAYRPVSENISNGDKFSPFTARTSTNSTVYTSDGNKAVRSSLVGGRIGSIADYDPMNENYGSLAKGYKPASRQTSVVKDGDDDGFDSVVEIKPETQDEDKQEADNTETTNAKEEIVEEQIPEQVIEEEVPPSNDENENEGITAKAGVSIPAQVVIAANELFDNALVSIEKELREQKLNSPEEGEGDDGNTAVGIVAEQQGATEDKDQSGAVVTEVIGVDDGEGGEIITTPLPGEYIALFDYEAQDVDEVSFLEDDIIIEVEKIDDGWLLGTVAKSGQRGMLPANYVQFHKD